MGPLHHRCFHANSFPQKRLTQLYVGRIRACALDLWRTDHQRRAAAKKGAEGHSKFLFQQVTSAILLRLWQNLRSTSQARCARASMIQDIKSKALDLALSQIEKQFGKGSIMKLGEQAIEADIPVI